jgi:hypothetical protein
MNYEECTLNQQGGCSSYKRYQDVIDGLFTIEQLDRDVSKHFKNLKLNSTNHEWNELKLIENRLMRSLNKSEKLCAYHRFTNGIGWKPSKKCGHPNHDKLIQAKAPTTRSVPITLLTSVFTMYKINLPIGTVMCHSHLNEVRNYKKDTPNLPEHNQDFDDFDQDYIPEEIVFHENVLNPRSESNAMLSKYLDVSPVRFQINKTPIRMLSEDTKKYLKRKHQQYLNAVTKRFAETVAPTQSDEFISILHNVDAEKEKAVPIELVQYVTLYKESDSLSQTVILSLIDHHIFSKDTIINAFGCSRYKVDQARKWQAFSDGLVLPEKVKFKRSKLNIQKCEHFLDFVFMSGLLQDVAYGMTKVKFDSGDEQKISHAILTTKFSHAISFYLQSCKTNG